MLCIMFHTCMCFTPQVLLKLFYNPHVQSMKGKVDFLVLHRTQLGRDRAVYDFQQSFAYPVAKSGKSGFTERDPDFMYDKNIVPGGFKTVDDEGRYKKWQCGHCIDRVDTKCSGTESSHNDPDNYVAEPKERRDKHCNWGGIVRRDIAGACRKQGSCYAQYAFYSPRGVECKHWHPAVFMSALHAWQA